MNNTVENYFRLGFQNKEMLYYLTVGHNVLISNSTLKIMLRRLHLFRRKSYTDLLDVAMFVMSEIQASGQCHGYRWMHQKCIQVGINIPRDTVMYLLQICDPAGVANRKRRRLCRRQYSSKGPNYVWHIDGYDKLKPYGIAIHGCIDGFSRQIIWMEAHKTNNDPQVIGHYFIDAVKNKAGYPQRVRADMGTENVYVEQMQICLRRNHMDELAGERSFLYGKSTSNQRIEWFWGLLRKEMCQFWMTMFRSFTEEENVTFCGDLLDKSLIQFCFMDIIQSELNEVASTWNAHKIRSVRSPFGGGSRPLTMYNFPELFDADERLCSMDATDVQLYEEETTGKGIYTCDETIYELSQIIMEANTWVMPANAAEGRILYFHLREIIKALL